MKLVLIFGALAIVLIAGALLFVERRIRARTRRVLEAQPAIDGERVLELRMRHSTAFADGLPALFEAGDVDVVCTAAVLAAGRLVIPLGAVEDAAIERGALRVRWTVRGEKLVTTLEAPVHDLERLRREIHLRQPNVIEKLLSMVQNK
ncbi:MAG: hypothetical protein ABR567_11925 [Myxococcales bacterium]|nr:hypothetical protein [Myxococcales bacterium]